MEGSIQSGLRGGRVLILALRQPSVSVSLLGLLGTLTLGGKTVDFGRGNSRPDLRALKREEGSTMDGPADSRLQTQPEPGAKRFIPTAPCHLNTARGCLSEQVLKNAAGAYAFFPFRPQVSQASHLPLKRCSGACGGEGSSFIRYLPIHPCSISFSLSGR